MAENTSWSCAHGVERWRSNCGCNGGKAGWNQRWRAPLREKPLIFFAIAPRRSPKQWQRHSSRISGPLATSYIHVILDRSSDNLDRFFSAHAKRTLTSAERITVFELLELERHTQLMYTSCGWFFDDIAGIETVQIIAYAGRVIQLANKLLRPPRVRVPPISILRCGRLPQLSKPDFLEVLARAQSNDPEAGTGADVYRRFVNAAASTSKASAPHYAISSMFRSYPDAGNIFCFDVNRHSYDVMTSGRGRFAVGRATLCSRITEECEDICFAVLHLGDQNLSAAVKRYTPQDAAAWETFITNARHSIRHANLPSSFASSMASLTAPSIPSRPSSPTNSTASCRASSTRLFLKWKARSSASTTSTLPCLTSSPTPRSPLPPALALTAGFAINASPASRPRSRYLRLRRDRPPSATL